MRFDVSLIFSAALFGAAVQAAALPKADDRTVNNQIEQIEEEIVRLEEQLAKDLAELEQHEDHHHPGHPQAASSSAASASSSAAAASSTGSAETSQSTGTPAATLSASYLSGITSSITLPSASSVATFDASSVLLSLSSVAANLSSAASSVSSVNATVSNTLATAYSSSASASTTTVAQTSTIIPVSSGYSSVASYVSGPSSSVPAFVNSTALSYSASSSAFPYASGASSSAIVSANSTASSYSGSTTSASSFLTSASIAVSANSTSFAATGTGSLTLTSTSSKSVTANSTSAYLTGTATMAPTPSALGNATVNSNITSSTTCTDLCSSLTFSSDLTVTPYTCEVFETGSTITVPSGQSAVGCGTSETAPLDLCRITLGITTSDVSEVYMEVWLPNDNTTAWNGRTMSTDNGGINGCVAYDDMAYVTGMGFAAFGDNSGRNASAYDGTGFLDNHEVVLDWVYRSRHESVVAGKEIVKQFYGEEQDYAYYIGCSAGGAQGLHSAQYFPDDFDGIIAGSPAADFNHLQDWSARFIQLTGNTTDPRFLTEDQWIFVQGYIFDQCDAALDGVDDGIIEDPTICMFDETVIPVCSGNSTDNCLTDDQLTTVYEIFTELYSTTGELLYPALFYGAQVDAFRLGQLSGSTQGIAHDWYNYGIYNTSTFDITTLDQTDYAYADSLDAYNGNVSGFSGDLSAFRAAGKKMIMYHGMADPLVSAGNTQRYYLKVANTLGIDNTDMDDFMRFFRISGMAHCGVGSISGAGAWMFGQTALADIAGTADNIVTNLIDWVENDDAPETILGTKFWYDEEDLGLEFERPHCRFPYRTTYDGTGDWTLASSWGCVFIEDWQTCEVDAHPRLCNADGSFTSVAT